jgi:uncharacterized protein (TIGR02145 family)
MSTKSLAVSCLAWMCAFHALPGFPAAAMAQSPGDTVMDIDGNVYRTVTIGAQVWMTENLKTTRLNDGTPIPLAPIANVWRTTVNPAYCWPENDSSHKDTYGALYNWHAVRTGKLAPPGWHVPTDEDWTLLADYLGGGAVAGGKLKDTGTAHWKSPNSAATNETGFTALPGGERNYDGVFTVPKERGFWWTSSLYNADSAIIFRAMYHDDDILWSYGKLRGNGLSVRCIRNSLPAKVALRTPAPGSRISTDQVPLAWSKSAPGITGYRLNLAQDSLFTDMRIDSTLTDTSTIIRDLEDGRTYWWRIRARNAEGWGEWSQPGSFTVSLPSLLRKRASGAAPILSSGDGTIRYHLPSGAPVSLRVYDMQGKIVFSREHLYQPAGRHEVFLASAPRHVPLVLEFKAGNRSGNLPLRIDR